MSKRTSRRGDRKRLRRQLNRTVGLLTIAARKLIRVRYGDGANQRSFGSPSETKE